MSGREQLFSSDFEEERIVRETLEEFFRAENPERIAELDDNFDLFHSLVGEAGETAGLGQQAGDRSFEGLPADFAFFAGGAVSSAIWAATLLYRNLAERGRPLEQKLETLLAELTGNPAMIRRLHQLLAARSRDLGSLAAGLEGLQPAEEAGELRDFQRKTAKRVSLETPPEPPGELPEPDGAAGAGAAPPENRVAPGADADLSLFVEAGPDNTLVFRLHARRPELGLVYSKMGSSPLLRELHEHVAAFAREAEKLHQPSFDREDAAGRLERLGARLAQDILPAPLRETLDRLRGQVDSVAVYSDVPIPWDLLRFADHGGQRGAFYCEAFSLAGWLPAQPACFDLPLRRIGLIAPASDLAATAFEAKALLAAAGPDRQVRELPVRRAPLIEALRRLPLDGIHFAGHGNTAPSPHPDLASLQLEGDDSLDAIDIAPGSFPARPLVFLNACHSGVGAPALTGFGGLARAFVRAGAAAVIGSHWAINDRLAATFAAETYRRLLAGVPLARAVREARLHLRRAHPGDPTWVAYTVFGQPLAACRREPAGS